MELSLMGFLSARCHQTVGNMLFARIEIAHHSTDTSPSICGMGPHSASCPEIPLRWPWWVFSM